MVGENTTLTLRYPPNRPSPEAGRLRSASQELATSPRQPIRPSRSLQTLTNTTSTYRNHVSPRQEVPCARRYARPPLEPYASYPEESRIGRKINGKRMNTDARDDIAKPMWPFYAAGLIIAYGINAGAVAMSQCTFEP